MAYRGIEAREEIRKSRRTRDVRNFGQKWRDFFADSSSSVLFLMRQKRYSCFIFCSAGNITVLIG